MGWAHFAMRHGGTVVEEEESSKATIIRASSVDSW